jgi:hypothetical protein
MLNIKLLCPETGKIYLTLSIHDGNSKTFFKIYAIKSKREDRNVSAKF